MPTRPAVPSISLADWGLLTLLSVIWGGGFFFVSIAVKVLPPFTIVAGRLLGAAIVLNLVLRLTGQRIPTAPRTLGALVVMGIINNAVPFSLLSWGQGHIASGLAAIFNATTPLFTVVLAHVATRDERLTAGRGLGVMVGFAGVVAMVGPKLLTGADASLVASLACIGAAVSYALASIFGRRFRIMGLTPLATAAGQVTASSLMMVPLALAVDTPWRLWPVPASALGSVAFLALASTATGYILFFRLLASAGATGTSIVTFMVPVSAILLGTTFLGERLAPEHVVGMALIGFGLALIDGRPARRLGRALGIGGRD